MSVHPLEAFGIPTGQITQELERQKSDFLRKQGWTKEVLARFGLTFHLNTPIGAAESFWHPKFRKQLQGHNYIGIEFASIEGTVINTYVFDAGTEIPFRRARLLDWPQDKSGKYQQYPKSGVAVFVPQDSTAPNYWTNVAHDVSKPLVITEGEFDAIAGVLAGVPTLGVTGLDCFMDPANKRTPAQGAKDIKWKGRQVFICPDQDPESTPEIPFKGGGPDADDHRSVAAAAARLANNLALLGATVSYLCIIETAVGKANIGTKLGLTEYFKLGGTYDELGATRRKAETADPTIVEFLNRYAIVAGNVLDLETASVDAWRKFEITMANKRVMVLNKKGDEVLVPVSKIWLEHPARHTVTGFTFKPSSPPGIMPDSTFNLWKGFAVAPRFLGEPIDSEVAEAYEAYGSRLWGSLWPWVRGCVAHMFLHPEVLRQHMLVLQSPVTGIGKSAFFKLLITLIGEHHACEADPKRFFADFNVLYLRMIFVFFDEMHETSMRVASAVTKQITSTNITIEGKGVNSIIVPWYGTFAAATNQKYVMRSDKNDRRQAQSTPDVLLSEKREWQPEVQRLLTLLFREETLPSLMAYVTQEKWLADYDPRKDAPRTASLEESLAANKSEAERCAELFLPYLPVDFCFDADLGAGIPGVAGPDVATIEAVKALAVSKGICQLRRDGVQTWFTLYSKRQLDVQKNAQGRMVLKEPDSASLVRKALLDTQNAMLKFSNRNFVRPGGYSDITE